MYIGLFVALFVESQTLLDRDSSINYRCFFFKELIGLTSGHCHADHGEVSLQTILQTTHGSVGVEPQPSPQPHKFRLPDIHTAQPGL